jgi:hypothetical protein
MNDNEVQRICLGTKHKEHTQKRISKARRFEKEGSNFNFHGSKNEKSI